MLSELISASLDYYRAMRDAVSEAAFFQLYGNLFSLYLADKQAAIEEPLRSRTRVSCRSSKRLWPRSTKGDTRRRAREWLSCWRERASRSRCRVCNSSKSCSRIITNCCRPSRWIRRAESEASRKSSCATNPSARLRRCLCFSANARTVIGFLRYWIGFLPMNAYNASSRRASNWRCSSAFAASSLPRCSASTSRGDEVMGSKPAMGRKHEKYEQLLTRAKALPPLPTAVVHPCDEFSLTSAVEAAQMELIAPVLIGPIARIKAVARKSGLDVSRFEILDTAHSHASAERSRAVGPRGTGAVPYEGQPAHRRVHGRGGGA